MLGNCLELELAGLLKNNNNNNNLDSMHVPNCTFREDLDHDLPLPRRFLFLN